MQARQENGGMWTSKPYGLRYDGTQGPPYIRQAAQPLFAAGLLGGRVSPAGFDATGLKALRISTKQPSRCLRLGCLVDESGLAPESYGD